eukprot:TRINITY_DN2899_c0_g1_i7.p1 TRINITY_DN2899_c0_g1~~TRINITY_DN2899_c0_g1_i7.p1  ORF type:complete len:830 (+),score=73.86 TRINITY_DN2899_c0_g1_i7:79-2568(+)
MKLPRCNVAVVPAAWRIQRMSTTLQLMYLAVMLVVAAFKAAFDTSSGSWVSFEILVPFVAVESGILCALSRAKSKPYIFETIEVLYWCGIVVMTNASVLTTADSSLKESRMMMSIATTLLLPAILGIRLWVYLCLVPCIFVMNVFVLQYMSNVQGEPVRNNSYAFAPIIALFCLGACVWQNSLFWVTYSMQSALSFEKAAMEELTSLTCDATCWLANERGTVSTCDERVTDLFQTNMIGKALADVVVSEDASRLVQCLANARKNENGCVPVTLLPVTIVRYGVQVRLDLLIVHRNLAMQKVVAEGHMDDRLFFVGMRFGQADVVSDEPLLLQSDDMLDSVSVVSENDSDAGEPDNEEVDGRDGAHSASLLSLPRTTATGRIFNSADRPAHIGECLADVKALVEKEKWFIPPAELSLRVHSTLGEGGFGSVVVGRFHGAIVAVKLPKIEASKKGIKLLCNELRILRHARHPNLVQCFGAVIHMTSCRFGLVLEFVHGVSLFAFKFHMSDNVARSQRFQVIAGVSNALSYLHSRFPVIVHGDLKPDNVLIELRQVSVFPKLLDFGLSRLLTSRVKSLDGTLRWVAPEVLQRGGMRPKASVDVFALGYLIYYTTTGNLPYDNLSQEEIKARYRARVLAELTWSLQSDFDTMSKDLAERCLRPLKQRPSISEISRTLMAWSNRDSADDIRNTWRDFTDIEALRQASSDRHARAPGSARHRQLRNAKEPEVAQQSPSTCCSSRSLTSDNAKVQSFIDLLQHWNFEVPSRGCCVFHRGVVEMQALCARMEQAPCNTFALDRHSNQCDKCGWLSCERSKDSCYQCSICKEPMLLKL